MENLKTTTRNLVLGSILGSPEKWISVNSFQVSFQQLMRRMLLSLVKSGKLTKGRPQEVGRYK